MRAMSKRVEMQLGRVHSLADPHCLATPTKMMSSLELLDEEEVSLARSS